jgi:hypothetical protein
MDNDTKGIARLAIRLFSIIANSGATECNFSDYGNIQTKKRSRLSVEKTHKINVVHMDIHRRHASLGLLKCRGKRKLGDDDEPSSTAVDEPSDADADDDSGLAQNLINSAINDSAADVANEAEEATLPDHALMNNLNYFPTRQHSIVQMAAQDHGLPLSSSALIALSSLTPPSPILSPTQLPTTLTSGDIPILLDLVDQAASSSLYGYCNPLDCVSQMEVGAVFQI